MVSVAFPSPPAAAASPCTAAAAGAPPPPSAAFSTPPQGRRPRYHQPHQQKIVHPSSSLSALSPRGINGGGRETMMVMALLHTSLEVLASIEENRQGATLDLKELSGLTMASIKVCQQGVQALGPRVKGGGAGSTSNHPPRLDPDALYGLLKCMDRAHQTLSKLRSQEVNYFGIFRSTVYLKDLNLLEGGISDLLRSLRRGAAEAQRPLSDTNHLIENPSAKIFWAKHFGNEVVEVPWVAFKNAFEREYGNHPEEAVERFKRAIVGGDGGPVCVDDYGRMTNRADGIYELFQECADPATMVYVMGTVEDDNHNNVAFYLPTVLDSFLGYSIEQVCCGGQHAAILTTSGHIYTWGRGGFGRLGHGDDAACPAPKLVRELADKATCRQVACGFAYTAAVTTDGQVYTWGAGENGRLGLGDEQDKTSPKHVEELASHRVKDIFAGSVHTCALLETGEVYSWGKSEYTGHGLQQDVWAPKLLDGFDGQPIVQISVGPGGYHTIALSASGEVYTWGHNRVGQLGYTNSEAVPRNHEGAFFLPTPRVVESLRELRVRRVIAGWGHSAVVCRNGDVYICGRNFQGQLGLGDPNDFERNERNHPYLANFRLVKGLKGQKVIQFACGGEHSAALLDSDDVYTFGSGVRGQLGHGEARNEHYPRLNQAMRGSCRRIKEAMRGSRHRIKEVACGNNCTVLLVGEYRMPKLMEICIERIVEHWEMYEYLDFQELLPLELSSMIQRLRHHGPLGSHSHHHYIPISSSNATADTQQQHEGEGDEGGVEEGGAAAGGRGGG